MTNEEEAIQELKSMSQSELDLVSYDTVKLICQVKGCKCYKRIRDYGLSPIYWVKGYKLKWWDIDKTFFLCAKHWKFYNRISKIYTVDHIQRKIIDFNKLPIQKL